MAIHITNPEIERLARALSAATGESVETVINTALLERLQRVQTVESQDLAAEIRLIQEQVARLPVIDDRSANALLGYDDHGLPH